MEWALPLRNILRYEKTSLPQPQDFTYAAFQQILPLLSETLVAPFATAYPPLLQASIKSVEAVLINDWPRISYYRGEILRGLTTCWCRIKDQETIPMELTKVQQSIKGALQLLRSLLKADIHVAEEFQILMASDDRLHDLVTV